MRIAMHNCAVNKTHKARNAFYRKGMSFPNLSGWTDPRKVAEWRMGRKMNNTSMMELSFGDGVLAERERERDIYIYIRYLYILSFIFIYNTFYIYIYSIHILIDDIEAVGGIV